MDTDYEEVVETISKPVRCILKSEKSEKSVVKIPTNHPCNFGFRAKPRGENGNHGLHGFNGLLESYES
jgi:hypothetical protein